MSATRYASVLGLGFGDCGKGHFVDALARRWGAHTVVRCNGGAQAGHNVVTVADAGVPARHHTFSQFGAGTLAHGVGTILLDPMVVHPTALLVEANVLGGIGVHDALSRLKIDARCRVTTPYHQAAGRLRERLRGTDAHGTCGVGVGETVRHALQHPDEVLCYADLGFSEARAMDKLQAIRKTLLTGLLPPASASADEAVAENLQALQDETLAARWLNQGRALAKQSPPASVEAIRAQMERPGCVLFEGAQGVLLDEWRGFHPHTTWSSISTEAIEGAASRMGIEAPIEHCGVLRSYLTRHGIGPLPTHDKSLDALLVEPHNSGEGWQGSFRRGHPDAVLLRYALEAVGHLSGLLISHLDVFDRGVGLKWCERYLRDSLPEAVCYVERLPLGNHEDLAHQAMLTDWLRDAQPEYAEETIDSAAAFLERVASVTDLPVTFGSYGPTFADVRDH